MKLLRDVAMLFWILAGIQVRAVELPPFLPGYYSPAFDVNGKSLSLVRQTSTNGIDQYVYSTADESLAISLENINCNYPQSKAIFRNVLLHLNSSISSNSGRFAEVTDSEFCAEVAGSNTVQHVYTYVLPASVQVWMYVTSNNSSNDLTGMFKLIRRFADKQRYMESLSDNVSMGHWGKQIYDYASQLINEGKTKEGLKVLKNHLVTAPFDYQAHVDFFKKSRDLSAATNSAGIVLKNAESAELIDRAAAFLGKKIPTINDIPVLDKNETGLELVLIPLPPCNIRLLSGAADTFEKITGVPVKIRRLKEKWEWKIPARIAFQRDCQTALVRFKGRNIDFTNWTKDQYTHALTEAMKNQDALSRYYIERFIKRIEKTPGQYCVDTYLTHFCDQLDPVRSDDVRTMYVGITEANIYSGDNNFLFSLGLTKGHSRASILSYYMMLGETLGEEYQSRQRLVERIAKELVPAGLKQLGIPRSVDPTCPYSYSSGIERLDQKTLRLSAPVKEALEKLKNPSGI